MTEIIRAQNLQTIQEIQHGFFTAPWGNCGFTDNPDANANRAGVARAMGIAPENLISCLQIHSPDVVTVTKPWRVDDRPRADAMVTNVAGIGLGILTADCGPLLFVDAGAGVIGAAHAGWRGALSGVIENTIVAMEGLGARRNHIHVALGACIWQQSYEVGADFPAPFIAENQGNAHFFRRAERDGHFMFNLPAYIMAKVERAKLASISPSPADTLPDAGRFFSYRRSCLQGVGKSGSLISVITLRKG